MRRAFVRIGERLAAEGCLVQADDVFFVTLEEARELSQLWPDETFTDSARWYSIEVVHLSGTECDMDDQWTLTISPLLLYRSSLS